MSVRRLGNSSNFQCYLSQGDFTLEPSAQILIVSKGRPRYRCSSCVFLDLQLDVVMHSSLNDELFPLQDHKGMTPLLLAASGGHARVIGAILGALAVDMRNAALAATDASTGENALHLACLDGHVQCVKVILSEVGFVERGLSFRPRSFQFFGERHRASLSQPRRYALT